MKRIKALSFFTGAMGLDIGLKKAGIDVILACESEKFIRETIKLNNPKLKVLEDINHFLDLGWKNPYGETDPVVYTARNGANDRDGRMRFDETECSSGSSKKQIALWIKTHKEYYPVLIAKDGWCN